MPSQQAWTEDPLAENSLFPYPGQLSFTSIREPHSRPLLSYMEPSRCWTGILFSPTFSHPDYPYPPPGSWSPFTTIFLSSSVHTPLGQHFAIRGSQFNFAV